MRHLRFRLAEALDRLPELAARYSQPADYSPRTGDYRLLFDCFSLPTLAERLFLLFEHMRIQGHLLRSYPGLARHLTAFQTQQLQQLEIKPIYWVRQRLGCWARTLIPWPPMTRLGQMFIAACMNTPR